MPYYSTLLSRVQIINTHNEHKYLTLFVLQKASLISFLQTLHKIENALFPEIVRLNKDVFLFYFFFCLNNAMSTFGAPLGGERQGGQVRFLGDFGVLVHPPSGVYSAKPLHSGYVKYCRLTIAQTIALRSAVKGA